MQMFFQFLLNNNLYIPHGHCYLWQPGLVGLHLISDILIAIAYYSIPLALIYFARKRQDVPFSGMFLLFSAFIIACGTTHILEVWTLWHPTYWLSGLAKAMTALISVYTAVTLVALLPQLLILPSLPATNQALKKEIAERQKTEIALQQSETTLKLFAKFAPTGIAMFDRTMHYIVASQRWIEDYHLEPLATLQGRSHYDVFPEIPERWQLIHQRCLAGEIEHCEEDLFKRADGSQQWLRWEVRPWYTINQEIGGIIIFSEDITERKQAEANLRESEERFRSTFEQAAVGVSHVSLSGQFLRVNQRFCDITGYSQSELQTLTFQEITHPDDLQADLEQVQNLLANKIQTYSMEKRYIRQDRSTVWINLTVSLVRDQVSKPKYFISVIEDITDRKQAEASLARLAAIVESSGDAIISKTLDGIIQSWNAGAEKLFGYTAEEIVGQSVRLLIPDERQDEEAQILEKLGRGETIEHYETVRQAKDGTLIDISLTISPIRDAADKIIGASKIARDIRPRKQAEAERKEAEKLRLELQLLENILEVTLAGYWDWDIPGNQEYLSPTFKRMLGYEEHELPNTPESWQHLIFPEDLPIVLNCFDQHIKSRGQIPYYNEVRYRHKNGSTIWVICSGRVIEWDQNDKPLRMVGCHIDITERKQTEQFLKISEARYRAIVEDQTELISRFLPDTTMLFVNQAYCRYFGLQPEEVIGKSYQPIVFEEDRETVNQLVQSMNTDNPTVTIENRVIVNGEVRWTQWVNRMLFDQQGQFLEFQSVGRDITDRKQMEESLQVSEERLQLALEGSGDGLWDWNILTGEVYLSSLWLEMLGYAEGELPHHVSIWEQLIHPDDKPWVIELLNAHLKNSAASYAFDYRVRTKSGDWKWVANYGKVVARDPQGAPLRMVGTHKDITERKQAEAALRESERRFATLAAAAPVAIFRLDATAQYIYVNDRWSEMTGRAAAAAMGMGWVKTLHPEDRAQTELKWSQWAETKESAASFRNEARILRPDGSILWYYCLMLPELNPGGRVIGYIGTLTDITDRKQAEQTLQDLNIAMENAVEGISRIDTDGQYLSVNWAYAHACGYEPEELVGQQWQQTVHPEDIPVLTQAYQQMLESGKVEVEARGIRKDGSIFYKQVTMVTVYDEAGRFTGHHCFLKDITDRKQAEDALANYAREIKDLYNNAPCGYHSLDAEGRYININETELQWLGYTREEMINKCFAHFVTEAGRSIFERTYPRFKTQGWVRDLEFDLICKDGTLFPVLLSATAVKNADGTYLHSRSTLYDNRDRKQAEAQLRLSSDRLSLANTELARAARLKDEFLASMSHELRTPLNAILGLSEALLEEVCGTLNEQQRHSLLTIERSGQHLLELINDILDLSKIESGKMELEVALIPVQYLCDSSLALVKQQANHKHIKLNCQVAENLIHIEADERRIRQVLVNLLSNAVKFTCEGGSVQLQATVNLLQKSVEFSVIDTGIGIASEQFDKLFQPFVQLDSSLSRRYKGTGLGLALVRRIVELHNGSVSLESQVGQGTCFTIALPWQSSCHVPVQAVQNDGEKLLVPHNLQALIVEDSETAATQLSRYLAELGAKAIVHSHGEGVIAKVLQSRPDVIVLDILLPDQSGWEILMALKANLATRDIPVIVVSVVDERLHGLELGASEYLVKPITRHRLQQALNQVIESTKQPDLNTALVIVPEQFSAMPLVLLAEDNEANIATLMLYLQAHGWQVVLARNGLEAVEMAKQYQPDVIVMDIQMPEMDGLEATVRIRSDAQLRQVPIVALTALAMPGDREKCLAAGANDYLTKPVSLKQLLTLISTYVPASQGSQ